MTATAVKARLRHILPLRALLLQEMNCQIRYDACHARGWTDSYLLAIDDVNVGYGSIKGQEIDDRDTVFEFYVVPAFRKWSSLLCRELIRTSGATSIECQSNDALLSSMLEQFSRDVGADVVLFEDHAVTDWSVAGGVVRPRRLRDQIFEHEVEPIGEYVLEAGGEIVATAGFMLHYNFPFADLYMEVRKDCRGRGYGAFVLQEVKKACYLTGRVPAARTDLQNNASRATLTKAGLRISGVMLTGRIDADAIGGS